MAAYLILVGRGGLAAQNAEDQGQASDSSTGSPPDDSGSAAAPYAKLSGEQLDRLVAPIALYPDALIAQVLSASTFPAQITEAEDFLNSHRWLNSTELGGQVDLQPWDPSVKALVQFPSVLANLSKNLGWTSELGDAYYNQQGDVMNAVQEMRKRAKKAGHLASTAQLNVEDQDNQIDIEPVDPEVVYVPAYDPWLVYGYAIAPWPYWVEIPDLWWAGSGIYFGVGFPVAPFYGFGWGWHWWGVDWHHHGIFFHRAPYYARGPAFFDRGAYYGGRRDDGGHDGRHGRGHDAGGRDGRHDGGHDAGGGDPRHDGGHDVGRGTDRGGDFSHMGGNPGRTGDRGGYRGFSPPREGSGVRSGAFSGINHGGVTRGFSARGQSSFGGFHGGGFRGGGFHGGDGGGGFHGGGGGRR
ncbi:MAG: DUF3300 domain-containing protein [Acidobacteriaceae bacterium]|nr:DUF3300 domain-containing protein [Acidobacteriaceae bacterium]